MAIARKVVKVANPGRRRGKYRLRAARHSRGSPSKRKRSNPSRRRRMTPKQIRHFGTKAQRAALKRRLRGKRSSPKRASNPRRKHARRTRNARPKVRVIYRYKNASTHKKRRKARRKRSNPALVVTLGSVNPTRKRRTVARKAKRRNRKSSNPRHYRRRGVARHTRRKNRRRVAMIANPRRRRRNRVTHRRVHHRRRHNPALFGSRSTKSVMKISGGILAGVFIAKTIPKYVPASIASSIGSGGIMAVIISGVSALAAGYLGKMIDPEFGEGALWGGIAQTISVALNAFLPQVGGTFSLGDLVSGNFVVPQNPIRAGMAVPSMVAAARMSGLGAAAFPRAF